ncbi:MAG: hypothetical protein ABJD24_14805 [Acidimicrobiales bacterium]
MMRQYSADQRVAVAEMHAHFLADAVAFARIEAVLDPTTISKAAAVAAAQVLVTAQAAAAAVAAKA